MREGKGIMRLHTHGSEVEVVEDIAAGLPHGRAPVLLLAFVWVRVSNDQEMRYHHAP